MAEYKILMSNLGYMRGIDGRLSSHIFYAHRHIYCSEVAQKKSLRQLKEIIERENPDICCFVEIDKGSSDMAGLNQLESLINDKYHFFDIENKYGQQSRLRTFPFSKGKSNGFVAQEKLEFEKIYFDHGTKRLIYKIFLPGNITLFFAHFSLKRIIREKQLLQVRQLINEAPGDSILLGDFNILSGVSELSPLLQENNLRLMNDESKPTFKFHKINKMLDLCICTKSLAGRVDLKIIPQPYSDHSALLVGLQ